VSLHGRPAGIVRAWDGPEPRWERTLRVWADGAAHDRVSALRARRDGGGGLADWRFTAPDVERAGAGPLWDPWLAPPPATGSWAMLDEAGRVVMRGGGSRRGRAVVGHPRRTLVADAGGRRASGGVVGGDDVRGHVAGRAGPGAPGRGRRCCRGPRRRCRAPRRALVSTWLVDGAVVRVEAPLAAELPPWAADVAALARRVAAELPDGASPWGGGRVADCTEHAAAFVAAARAAGHDVRPAAGWLYVDEPEPRLWLHAWAEVRAGDRWVGGGPDAGHVPGRRRPAPRGRLRRGPGPERRIGRDHPGPAVDGPRVLGGERRVVLSTALLAIAGCGPDPEPVLVLAGPPEVHATALGARCRTRWSRSTTARRRRA
jgi:hypothetical protein